MIDCGPQIFDGRTVLVNEIGADGYVCAGCPNEAKFVIVEVQYNRDDNPAKLVARDTGYWDCWFYCGECSIGGG